MADTRGNESTIFRKSAMSRIASTDDLDNYIKVTNPSAWIVLLAALSLIGGLVVWACTASVPSTTEVTGFVTNGTIHCWVDDAIRDDILGGTAAASVNGEPALFTSVEELPRSAAEVRSMIATDYIVESITLGNWNYSVTIEAPDSLQKLAGDEVRLVSVSITTDVQRPIDLVLGLE